VTTDDLDPLIHVPTRLKIVATLAALPDGDALSFTRLQNMIGHPRQPKGVVSTTPPSMVPSLISAMSSATPV
jgi:hypothetical protein